MAGKLAPALRPRPLPRRPLNSQQHNHDGNQLKRAEYCKWNPVKHGMQRSKEISHAEAFQFLQQCSDHLNDNTALRPF